MVIREATEDDIDELYGGFARIVATKEGFPQVAPLTRADFDGTWVVGSSAVCVARFGAYLIGGYYIRPNFVGRAAHIANAGYFVLAAYRGTGVGRSLVEHSLREARRLGFDAMQFNLVFESNPARSMYTRLGFTEVGRIPQRHRPRGGHADLLAQPRRRRPRLADREVSGAMGGADVTVEQDGDHVGVVCLRRPPNNFFDTSVVAAVADGYEELAAAGWCRCIVLASEGRHFCAGLDFGANAGQDIADLYREGRRLFAAPLPVVAAVQGAAVGGGCGLALSADFRVASGGSRFSANFARLGFHHGFGLSVTLPAAVGQQAAADLLLTGRRISGEEAFALGLCDRLAPDGEVLDHALAYAGELASAGPLAVRAIRATLRQGLLERVAQAMDHEGGEQLRLRHSEDFAEGVRASAERREPRFTGT